MKGLKSMSSINARQAVNFVIAFLLLTLPLFGQTSRYPKKTFDEAVVALKKANVSITRYETDAAYAARRLSPAFLAETCFEFEIDPLFSYVANDSRFDFILSKVSSTPFPKGYSGPLGRIGWANAIGGVQSHSNYNGTYLSGNHLLFLGIAPNPSMAPGDPGKFQVDSSRPLLWPAFLVEPPLAETLEEYLRLRIQSCYIGQESPDSSDFRLLGYSTSYKNYLTGIVQPTTLKTLPDLERYERIYLFHPLHVDLIDNRGGEALLSWDYEPFFGLEPRNISGKLQVPMATSAPSLPTKSPKTSKPTKIK